MKQDTQDGSACKLFQAMLRDSSCYRHFEIVTGISNSCAVVNSKNGTLSGHITIAPNHVNYTIMGGYNFVGAIMEKTPDLLTD